MTFDQMFFISLFVGILMFAQGEYYRYKLKNIGLRCQQLLERSRRYVEKTKVAYDNQAAEINKQFKYFHEEIAYLKEELKFGLASYGILSNHNLGFITVDTLNTTYLPLPQITLNDECWFPVSNYVLSNDNYSGVQVDVCCFANQSEIAFRFFKRTLEKYRTIKLQEHIYAE